MKHKHYDLIVQWASDPEAWRVEYEVSGFRWIDCTESPVWDSRLKLRLIPKRRMMHLNGVEFPAPEKEAPPDGVTAYTPDPHVNSIIDFTWRDRDYERKWLKNGFVHLTREAAEAHARAMLAAKEVE